MQKPLLLDNLLTDDDTSSYASDNHNCDYMLKNKLVIRDYERSEGEVGDIGDVYASLGEYRSKVGALGLTHGEVDCPNDPNLVPVVSESHEKMCSFNRKAIPADAMIS